MGHEILGNCYQQRAVSHHIRCVPCGGRGGQARRGSLGAVRPGPSLHSRDQPHTQDTRTKNQYPLNLHSGQISEFHFLFCSFGGFLKVGQFQTSLLLVSFHRNPVGRLCSQEAFHFLIFIRKTFLQW